MRSLLRAGVALAALATQASAQSITARVGDSVFVGFFVLDQSPHVFRGGATFTVCGTKKLYARFYSDARLTKLLTNDSAAVNVPCSTDTTKVQPSPIDTTRTQPPIVRYPGFPSCAGIVSDSSVHLPYCSPPAAPPLFLRVYSGTGTPSISCQLNRWVGTGWILMDSLCAPVVGCETQNDALGGSADHPKAFTCADTIGLFARTNLFSPTIPPN
jgi:hypothetical protein